MSLPGTIPQDIWLLQNAGNAGNAAFNRAHPGSPHIHDTGPTHPRHTSPTSTPTTPLQRSSTTTLTVQRAEREWYDEPALDQTEQEFYRTAANAAGWHSQASTVPADVSAATYYERGDTPGLFASDQAELTPFIYEDFPPAPQATYSQASPSALDPDQPRCADESCRKPLGSVRRGTYYCNDTCGNRHRRKLKHAGQKSLSPVDKTVLGFLLGAMEPIQKKTIIERISPSAKSISNSLVLLKKLGLVDHYKNARTYRINDQGRAELAKLHDWADSVK